MNDKYEQINSLVNAYKSGDKEVIFDLYEYYRPLLLASVKRCINKEPNLATFKEDLIEDSFFVFEKLLDQFEPDLTYFSYFVSTRIDINLFRYATEKYKPLYLIDDNPNFEQLYYDPFNRIDDMIVIHSALNQLNIKQREAIELYFFDGLEQDEAAEILKITQSSFSKRLQRALLKLKEILGSDFLA